MSVSRVGLGRLSKKRTLADCSNQGKVAKMEISSCVKAVSMAANQFSNNRSSSNMGYLLHQLEV